MKCEGARPRSLLGPWILLLLLEAPSHGYQLIDRSSCLFATARAGPCL